MDLERTPQTPPIINPLSDADSRIIWSVMIPVYNCIHYLRETLESVLQQAFPEEVMQIMVIDDCSTDGNVAELVQTVGNGRIDYFKKDKNGGSLRNFESCINKARGKYVHILHGDDKISPGFYAEMERLYNEYPQVGACFSNYDFIDQNSRQVDTTEVLQKASGIVANWLDKIACKNLIQPPAIVVKREVYEHLGSFFGVHYGEDWEMWVRIASHYSVAYSPKLLAHYRIHTTNITTNSILSGKNVKDIQKVINIISNYLPENKRRKLRNEASKNFAAYFAALSHRIYHEHGEPKAALMQAYLATRMYMSGTTVKEMGKIVIKCLINYRRA